MHLIIGQPREYSAQNDNQEAHLHKWEKQKDTLLCEYSMKYQEVCTTHGRMQARSR